MPPKKIIIEYQCFSVNIRNNDHQITISFNTDECNYDMISPEELDDINEKINNIINKKQDITKLFETLP